MTQKTADANLHNQNPSLNHTALALRSYASLLDVRDDIAQHIVDRLVAKLKV